jgi:hypothetical protein
VFPFLGSSCAAGRPVRIVAVEPAACPSLTRGRYAYDFGDTGKLTPLVKMHTLGSSFTPPGFHAGGLRYHGMAPMVSHIKELGLIEARAYHQRACFEAGVLFARTEGIVPAPEANHAVKGAIDEALRCREEDTSRTILFNLCGHGHFDMQAYTDYFAGRLQDAVLRGGRARDGAGRLAVCARVATGREERATAAPRRGSSSKLSRVPGVRLRDSRFPRSDNRRSSGAGTEDTNPHLRVA